MTSNNGNNSDRLDRIEAIVESNSRAIQAMMEQRATDRLEHEERIRRLEDTVIRLDDTVARLTRIEEAQNRMLASMDEDRPTVLRKLTAIENKVDTLLERNQYLGDRHSQKISLTHAIANFRNIQSTTRRSIN